ncbi:MAG: chromosomal replication initiator protein DnaA [Oscillospiraceae bacterium]
MILLDSFEDVFKNVLKACEANPKISEIGFNKWINILEPYKFENNTAYLLTESEFTKKTTLEVYEPMIKQAFADVMGFDVNIELLVKSKPEKTIEEPKPSLNNDTPVGDTLTFDNFIKGKSNELAYAFCISVAGKNDSSPSQVANRTFNPLFIYGDSGLGKTHLLKAIEHEVKSKNPNLNIIYTTGENFVNELVMALEYKKTIEFHNKYRNADFLLIDDIQFIAGKERAQEEFFHTFNDLYNAQKQIVLTSDIAPSKISKLENRIRSRFSLGVQVDIQPPDFETRMAIVKKKAENVGLQLSDNVARIIAEKVKTNIRQLEGTVNKIRALTSFTNEAPSISMAQRVIKEILISEHPAEITVTNILNEISAAFQVTPEEIKSQNRRANISLARKVAIYLMKELKGMTYIQIGQELNKNHSTMTIHYQEISKKISENSDLKETVDDIIKNLKNS